MNDSLQGSLAGPHRHLDPAEMVAAIEAQSTKHETACGEGHIVWRRWGEGSPVVLMHGGAGAWSHWIRNIGPLSTRHTVWALDIPGFGESAVPEELSIEAISEAVARGLRMLIPGDELVNVVGFSFGSALATMIAARLEGRLCNLALLGARFAWYSKPVKFHLVSWKRIADPVERLAAHRRNLEIMMIADGKNVDALAVYLQSTNAERARISARKWKPNSAEKLQEYLPQVRARGGVTVICGHEDKGAQLIIDNQASAPQAIYPGARFHIIENAGHWVQYEAAGRVNEILLDALAAAG